MVMPLAIGRQTRVAPKPSAANGSPRSWRLATQLLVAAAVVLVPLTAAAAMAAVELRTASVEARRSTLDVADLTGVTHLQAQLRQLRGDVQQSAHPGTVRRLLPVIDARVASLRGARSASAQVPAQRVMAYWPAIRAAALRSVAAGPSGSSANDQDLFLTWLEPMRAQLDLVAAASSADLRGDLRSAQERGQRDRTWLAAVLFVAVALAALAVVWLQRGLAEPLRRLETAARRFGRGELTYPLEVTGPHELGQVATAFREMAGQLSASRAQLEHRALHDELTGLANRALFTDRVGHALASANRRTESLAVAFIDLDGFKSVNDTLGHHEGNNLLRQVAAALTGAVRPGDTVARLGGDEFAILFEDIDPAMLDNVTRRLHEGLAAIESAAGLPVRASLGVAEADGATSATAADLLRDADTAMYAAKRRGAGRTMWFTPQLRNELVDRVRLQSDLAQAAGAGQLRLHYQPIIDLPTGRLAGVEALLRWQHPTRGLLAPGTFIGIAESSGLITEVGSWALESATTQIGGLIAALGRPLEVCVNVSPLQLEQPQFLDDVRAALGSSGLAAVRLTMEITESALVADAEPVLHRLKQLGIRLAVDDFGTGYSALHYLRRFPLDFLKIDRSFVDGLREGPAGEDRAIVRAIIDLAHGLGLGTIAEGVERPAQLRQLRELGCGQAQGFHLAEPMPFDQLGDWALAWDRSDGVVAKARKSTSFR